MVLEAQQPRDSMPRLFGYLRDERRRYVLGIAALTLTNLATAGIPYLTKMAVDRLEAATLDAGSLAAAMGSEGTLQAVGWLVGAIVLLAVLMAGFRVQSRVLIFDGGRRVEYAIRNDLFVHLQRLGPRFFGQLSVGDLISRCTNDIMALRLLGGPGVLNAANTVIVYFAAVIPMLLLDARITGLALLPLLLLFAATRVIGPRIYRASFNAQEELSRLSEHANESIAGIGVVQAYVREEARQESFELASEAYRRTYLRWVLYRAVLLPIVAGMGGIGTLAILWFGGRAVITGVLSLGDLVAFLGYLSMLMWPTVALGWLVSMWQRGRAAMDRLSELFETEPEVVSGAMNAPSVPLEGRVEFRDLSYRYGEGDEVLSNVSLTIEPGDQVLIVGPSGAGKSTLVSLLPHLAAVPRGSLFIDGHDVNDLPLSWLRLQMAFVPQEPFLFNMSARENIGFGLSGELTGRVEDAATLASLDEDLSDFADGLETLIGERGVSLSGGQRQRMTIARAAAMQPVIWIFDDCLSSVDAATEQQIIRNLRERTEKTTAVFVSHRLLGFEAVDRIVVLDKGKILEQGRHTDLVEAGGWYSRLYARQRLTEDFAESDESIGATGAGDSL